MMKRIFLLALLLGMVLGFTSFVLAQPPITIGAAVSLSGRTAREGQNQVEGYRLWEMDVNARGGILGRPVKLVIYDDESEPATAVKLYEKLITSDKVDLVFGPYSSPIASAVSPVLEKYRYPSLMPGSAAADIWSRGFKNIFQIYSPAEFYFDGTVELMVKNGVTRVAVLSEATLFAKEAAEGAIKKLRLKGVEVVFREDYPRGATDLSPLLSKIKAIRPPVEAIIGGAYLPDSVLITRQTKELDINVKMLSFMVGAALLEFYKTLGKDAEFAFGPNQWETTLKTPGNREFVERYNKTFKRDPEYHSAGGYAAGQILEAAVKRVGSLDKDKLREALRTIEVETVFGKYKVDEAGLQVGHEMSTLQWQDGKKVTVHPTKYATAVERFPMPAWKSR